MDIKINKIGENPINPKLKMPSAQYECGFSSGIIFFSYNSALETKPLPNK